ncbi:MAG TPA: Ig-like domain-containing protein, partial [Ferruginibacter sp.]|nr:Ig-like domain-containing protein [Ferruginibacter sp.]
MKKLLLSSESTLLRTRNGINSLFKNKWPLLLSMLILVGSCKKVDEETGLTGICPVVITTDPSNNSTDISVSAILTATFNEAMDPGSINTSTFTLKQGTNLVGGTISYNGLDAMFIPSTSLALNTLYTATITTGAKDPAGNSLKEDYIWSFTTTASPDINAPVVISTDPVNGDANVVLNKKISATFSKVMNPTSINGSFLLYDGTTAINGTISYTGVTAVFSPSANLSANTIYTATITTNAKDLAGNAMAANYIWTFTTGTTTDAILPTVTSTDPANGATAVLLNKIVTATFSEGMNPFTFNSTTFVLKNGANPVAGTVSYNGLTASFAPISGLLPNTIYTATITTAVQDLAGNAMAANYVWSFTTGTTSDIIPPTVISTDPMPGATGVILNKKVTVLFSEAMKLSTINNTTFLLKQGTTSIPGIVTYSGNTALFSPAA